MATNGTDPRSELARFDARVPIEDAETPPSSWYTDPAFLALERDRLFRRAWQPLALGHALREPGDYAADCRHGEPALLLRDVDGGLRGLRNHCLHHGAEVATGEGRVESRLVCPYHGWSYDLEGRLRSMPRADGLRGLEPGRAALAALPVASWGPLVFAALSGEAPPAASPVPASVDALGDVRDWAGFRPVARRQYRIRCNWKIFVDNYLDGGYHVAALHRGLAGQLDTASYVTELGDRHAVQRVDARGDGAAADGGVDFEERIGAGALYLWIHPNLMLNRYGPFLDVNRVWPLAADETEVVYDWLVAPGTDASEDFVARSLEASEAVQREDEAICESVQRGLGSSGFDRGRYAPRVEMAAHRFHCWLAEDLGDPDVGPASR